MCDTRGRGVARGKGPEIGNEGGLHCLQNGLSLSQTECLYIRDLVLNKDLFLFAFWDLIRSLFVLGAVHVVCLRPT